MINYIIIIILLSIISSILFYLYKQNKKGNHCIGCPCANKCKNNCHNKNI